MEISDVRVRLVKDTNDRLKAVCSVTLDEEFVVRDVKIVEGTHGLFVAMPSRKLSAPCQKCRTQNHLRARFCNECGGKLPPQRIPTDADGREKAHRDIAHPITAACRQAVQTQVLEAYQAEFEGVEDNDYDDTTSAEADTDAGEPQGDEYNTLIADLKGGGGETRRETEAARSGDGEARSADGLRRGRRKRGRRGRGPTDERRPARGEDSSRETAASEPEPVSAAFEQAQLGTSEAPADEPVCFGGATEAEPADEPVVERFGPPPAVDDEPETTERAGPSEEASEKPPPSTDSDEDTPFGAGIL